MIFYNSHNQSARLNKKSKSKKSFISISSYNSIIIIGCFAFASTIIMNQAESLSFGLGGESLKSRRALLPSRPTPLRDINTNSSSKKEDEKKQKEDLKEKVLLDAERLIGMERVGGVSISPDGTLAAFGVRKYDFDDKKFDEQLWLADLTKMSTTEKADSLSSSLSYLQKLTSGSQHGWSSANTPRFSSCGKHIAFLSNRNSNEKKTSVWILPVRGPGEATLLKEFPLSVGDLEWSHEVNGIIVSASVYVDDHDEKKDDEIDIMKATAARDEKIAKSEEDGGLNAVLYKRLPIREWDRWLDAKMAHPFFTPVVPTNDGTGGYKVPHSDSPAIDLLRGIPTSVPSGAFGGSEDWTVSKDGHVAVSARPPIAKDEAWTTNRHIYLFKNRIEVSTSLNASKSANDEFVECITTDNLGFDFNPVFSPDGTKLAWLSMKGEQYEADAVSIRIYDLATHETITILEAETDWDYSPNSLLWSRGNKNTIFFTADVKSRQALCSIDISSKEIHIIKGNQSTSLHGEILMNQEENDSNGHQFLASVQSLTMPTELFLIDTRNSDSEEKQGNFVQHQLTHFNTEIIAQTALGEPEEFFYKGENGDEVQAWLIRPANFNPETKYPLAVIYHGGPQGSSGDDWHYRWNLQFYASQGFAVLAPNFHGSTGFGHAFCRNISTNWKVGGVDTIDGVNALLSQVPWIDPSKVVGLGASYGGFTSNWLNGNAPEDMFKALVCHCGTFDLKSSYYATEELFFMETEFGGPAYLPEASKDSSPYKAYTPSAKVEKWNTPTLVIHGAKDFRLVESEGISTFTALQRRGVPSELLYLPTENHHCLNPQNSMVWHETVLRWIKTWT